MFDGYDTGIRYADDAVGRIVSHAGRPRGRTRTPPSSCRPTTAKASASSASTPTIRRPTRRPATSRPSCAGPACPAGEVDGLLYHLDVGATVVELAGLTPPPEWDGRSVAVALRAGEPLGREQLVVSQGAWSAQRSVRWDRYLYCHTRHDAFHAWPDRDGVRPRRRPARAARSGAATDPTSSPTDATGWRRGCRTNCVDHRARSIRWTS